MTTLYVGNLPDDIDESQLRTLFEKHGTVASIRLMQGSHRRRFDGFGLIEMAEPLEQAEVDRLDGILFHGTLLSVREATASDADTASAAASPRIRRQPSEAIPSAARTQHYEVAAVEKVDGPGGAAGDDWYRYVLASGNSQITGFHRGTLAEVREYAAGCAAAFEERSQRGKSARPLAAPRR